MRHESPATGEGSAPTEDFIAHFNVNQRGAHRRHVALLVVQLYDRALVSAGNVHSRLVALDVAYGVKLLQVGSLGHVPLQNLRLGDAFANVRQVEADDTEARRRDVEAPQRRCSCEDCGAGRGLDGKGRRRLAAGQDPQRPQGAKPAKHGVGYGSQPTHRLVMEEGRGNADGKPRPPNSNPGCRTADGINNVQSWQMRTPQL